MEIPSIWHSNSLSKRDGRKGAHFSPRNTYSTIILVEITKIPIKLLKWCYFGVSGCKMVPGAAIAFGQAITAPNWWYSHHLPPEMGIFLPKPLKTTIFVIFIKIHEMGGIW